MSTNNSTTKFHLQPEDNYRLANLCGQIDEHLRFLERQLQVKIQNRGLEFSIKGSEITIQQAQRIIEQLYGETANNVEITPVHIQLILQDNIQPEMTSTSAATSIHTKYKHIKPRNQHQLDYIQRIRHADLNFAIGPAGTGKTYLAVACAVEALAQNKVRRIVLVRPAVEAGEQLGFLPGDLSQKVDPYLRPLYDALYETLGFETVNQYIERGIIEIAPLAFMRGRTLNESFIILDESQNTTKEQMKMFLTRIGFCSKAVVCGDITQTDLAKHLTSGLHHCQAILKDIETINFTYFTAADVTRHPLVQRIVSAYEKHERDARN